MYKVWGREGRLQRDGSKVLWVSRGSQMKGFPGGSLFTSPPSDTGAAGSIPGRGPKTPHTKNTP